MAKKIDKENIREAYEDVRNDSSETNWAVLKYDENKCITLDSTGTDFEEFKSKFSDEERVYGFLRVITGDELSKRAKFALIAWLGSKVGALKRAQMGTDKSMVKEVISSYAVDLMYSELSEVKEEDIRTEIMKAGGANYGTGSR